MDVIQRPFGLFSWISSPPLRGKNWILVVRIIYTLKHDDYLVDWFSTPLGVTPVR